MTEKEKVLRRFERGRKAIIVASRASDAEEIAEKMDCSILEARKLIDWYEQNKNDPIVKMTVVNSLRYEA